MNDDFKDIIKINQELNNISTNFKLFNLLKYFMIHSYDSELIYLNRTLTLLKNLYNKEGKLSYTIFIDDLKNIFFPSENNFDNIPTNRKINMLVELINSNKHYELYDKIINTLQI